MTPKVVSRHLKVVSHPHLISSHLISSSSSSSSPYFFKIPGKSRFQIVNTTSQSISEKEVGLCKYHFRVSYHVISMSNVKYQMSHVRYQMSWQWPINVKCHGISMSKAYQMSSVMAYQCQMSWQNHINVKAQMS